MRFRKFCRILKENKILFTNANIMIENREEMKTKYVLYKLNRFIFNLINTVLIIFVLWSINFHNMQVQYISQKHDEKMYLLPSKKNKK